MPGNQLKFGVDGAQNEDIAKPLIGRLSAPVQAHGARDFGVDFFCQLYREGAAGSVAVDNIFAVQVKGPSETLTFGGVRDEKWRFYEIEWLRTLAVPYFLGRVDKERPRLDLYSLGPVWRVLWQTGNPFKIKVTTDPPSLQPHDRTEAAFEMLEVEHGDKRVWTVSLGPPFLSVVHGDLDGGISLEQAQRLLRRHVEMERQNLTRFQLGVAIHLCTQRWFTNDVADEFVFHKAMYWNTAPGANLDRLLGALEQIVLNLGVHLQYQNDADASRLIGVLEWLGEKGKLDGMGNGLLEGLRAASQPTK